MTEYCTTCGRCKSCGAKDGAKPTIVFQAQNNAAAAQAFGPVVIETYNGGGAGQPIMGCEHFEIRG